MVSIPAEPLKLGQGSDRECKQKVDWKYRVQASCMNYMKNEINAGLSFLSIDMTALKDSSLVSRKAFEFISFPFGM